MSENYNRACVVTLPGCSYTLSGDADAVIRMRFDIKQSSRQLPNVATIRLTNQLPALARQLCSPSSEHQSVTISAGYVDNQGIIFKGQLVRAIYGRESPTDTLTQILASDGEQAHNYATVNRTFPPGSTPQDHLNEAIKAYSQYGVNLGFVGQGVDLSKPKYPRSVALWGMARDVLRNIAKSKGAVTSVQNMLVHMNQPNDNTGGVTELNSATGLIGMPTLETGGIYARVLINPQLRVNSQVHIDQSLIQGLLPQLGPDGQPTAAFQPDATINASVAADGIYNIFKIDVEADTRGTPWYMDIACLAPGQSTPASQDALARQGQ